jgi:hypothetical protein
MSHIVILIRGIKSRAQEERTGVSRRNDRWNNAAGWSPIAQAGITASLLSMTLMAQFILGAELPACLFYPFL